MASKRQLYKPAAKENVGQKPKRKTLAQGIATEQPSVADPTLAPLRTVPMVTEAASPRRQAPAPSLDLSDNDDLDPSCLTPVRRAKAKSVLLLDASSGGSSPHSREVGRPN